MQSIEYVDATAASRTHNHNHNHRSSGGFKFAGGGGGTRGFPRVYSAPPPESDRVDGTRALASGGCEFAGTRGFPRVHSDPPPESDRLDGTRELAPGVGGARLPASRARVPTRIPASRASSARNPAGTRGRGAT